MKNKNYFTKYLILVLPLLFINLNAQDQVDPLEAARLAKSAAEKAQAEADAATEAAIQSAATKAASQARENAVQAKKDAEAKKLAEAEAAEEAELDALAKAAGDEAKRKIAQELGLDDGFSEEEAESTEAAAEEVEVAEEEDEVEEFVVKEKSGFGIGGAASVGLLAGETFSNVPTGGTFIISTPIGFKLGPFDFNVSLGFGGYSGTFEGVKGDLVFDPTFAGIGGNLTLADFVFAEGHAGLVGAGPGFRGFAGVTLERIMKRGLNLPFNLLVGSEAFISSEMTDGGAPSGWASLGLRLDYSF
jgi:hypothetical protein